MNNRLHKTQSAFSLAAALGLALLGSASTASAGAGLPPTDVYLGGILHTPLGGVTMGQTAERKLRACCLGSTGKDGVEVHYNTVSGGSVTLDPGSLPFGTSMSVSHKGWDGTVKGRCEIARDGADDFIMEVDFSGVGADSVRVLVTEANGDVLSDTTSLGSARFVNLNGVGVIGIGPCPDGSFPQWYESLKMVEPYFNGSQWVFWEIVWVYGCPGSLNTNRQVHVFPLFDSFPVSFGLASVLITGDTGGPLDVSDASLDFQGVQVWGVGGAHISEECDSPIGCTPSTVTLHTSNIGSSGQDGVECAIGPGGGGGGGGGSVTMEMAKCCRGHVTVLKVHDSGGNEQSVSRSPFGPGIDDEELDADFSSIGAVGFTLELFDVNHDPIGPVGGTDIINGGPRPWFTNRCPDGSREIWTNVGTTGNPVWEFQGCEGIAWDFVLPGGTVVPDVASYRITPLSPTSSMGALARCSVLRSGGDIQISSIALTPAACDGDANDDRVVDFDDITAALASWGADYSPLTGAGDANHDTVVNFDDITGVLANWGSTCP